jgi:hypothetical protein
MIQRHRLWHTVDELRALEVRGDVRDLGANPERTTESPSRLAGTARQEPAAQTPRAGTGRHGQAGGVRLHTEEVTGSIPVSPTSPSARRAACQRSVGQVLLLYLPDRTWPQEYVISKLPTSRLTRDSPQSATVDVRRERPRGAVRRPAPLALAQIEYPWANDDALSFQMSPRYERTPPPVSGG